MLFVPQHVIEQQKWYFNQLLVLTWKYMPMLELRNTVFEILTSFITMCNLKQSRIYINLTGLVSRFL